MKAIKIAGYKTLSLVDVLEHPSFTIWTTGCNFKCPWCSNTPVVEGKNAKHITIEEIIELLRESQKLIDYLHITGGEPTLQHQAIANLFQTVKAETNLKTSYDTNSSIPEAIEKLKPYTDHVAIDIKAPLNKISKYAMAIGLPERKTAETIEKIKKGIMAALDTPFLEFRTTMVPCIIEEEDIIEISKTVAEYAANRNGRTVYIVQQFIPYQNVRDPEYRSKKATPTQKVLEAGRQASKTTDIEVYLRTIKTGTQRVSQPKKRQYSRTHQ
ncbi:MAG: anaerobic ribonucleoside-triphosphate reductase activating protein [Thermoproteota archaeon]|nr:MAG: anaerobic ribonucleoside-triphosphate reductase activating protein [Candidatus Korarchaeota archaeon]